jgi:hypothetical protein
MSDDAKSQRVARLEASRQQAKQHQDQQLQTAGNTKGVFGKNSPLVTCGYKFCEGAFMGL